MARRSPVAAVLFLTLLLFWPVSFVRGFYGLVFGPSGVLLCGVWEGSVQFRADNLQSDHWFVDADFIDPRTAASIGPNDMIAPGAAWMPYFGLDDRGGVNGIIPFWCFLFGLVCWILFRTARANRHHRNQSIE